MTLVLDDLGVQDFLDAFAKAFTSGDGEGAAKLWEVPAFVLHKDGALAVSSAAQVAEFFGGASGQYAEQGVTGTRAEIERLDVVNDQIVIARVRWPYLDKNGKQRGAETSTYTLSRAKGADWKLRVAVMHGAEGG